MKKFLFLLAALCFCIALQAELAPSAYEAMQAKAPEYVKIEVLRVDVGPGESPMQQTVQMMAVVTEVMRTSTDLKPDAIINIHYTVTEHPPGWTGPGAIPILNEKDATIAYLAPASEGEYTPAAGRMSFSNF